MEEAETITKKENWAILSIKVTQETKDKLESIKVHPRETMDDCIKRLLRFRDWLAKMKKDHEENAPVNALGDSMAELRELWEYL